MACGIVNVGVRNDIDPALALCVDYVVHSSSTMRLGAIAGSVGVAWGVVWLLKKNFFFSGWGWHMQVLAEKTWWTLFRKFCGTPPPLLR